MKVGEAIAEIMKREGDRDPLRLPGQPPHRGGRRGRHPHDHRAPGAHRPAHGRRRLARDVRAARSASSACSTGRAPRTPSAASPRPTAIRSRSWCCRGATRAASPISTPTSTPSLKMRSITKWAEQVTSPAEVPDIMRRAFTQVRNGRPRPVLVEIPADIWTRRSGELDYTPGRRAPAPPPTRPTSRRAAAAILAAEAPGHLRRPGRPLRRGLGRAARAGRAARSAGHHQPRRQERLPGEPPAVARLRRHARSRRRCTTSSTTPTSSSASAAASGRPTSASRCRARARRSSTRRSIRTDLNKDCRSQHALIGDAELTLAGADRRDRRDRCKASRAAAPPRRRRDRRRARGVAGGVEAQADLGRDAALARTA